MAVLLRQGQALRRENEKLLKENAQLRNQEANFLDTIERLNHQVEALKLRAVDLSDPDRKAFEKTINTYIREIDRCIALLAE